MAALMFVIAGGISRRSSGACLWPDPDPDSFLPDGGEVQVQCHQRRGIDSTWRFLRKLIKKKRRTARSGGSITVAKTAEERNDRSEVAVVASEQASAYICPFGRNTRTSSPIPSAAAA